MSNSPHDGVVETVPGALVETVPGARGSYGTFERLGGGGMAEVWLARGPAPGALFAIKKPLFHPERLRIEHEAARPHHRFIAKSVELIEDAQGNPTHLVMEYVQGESLLKRRERLGQLAVEDSVKVIQSLALALDHLHCRGWIHRDVSPPNIMLEAGTEDVKLIDFGIARRVLPPFDPFGQMTQIGFFIGNPSYCAPEQFSAEPQFTPAVDIYALGGVLYYLLTGSAPFDGARFESSSRPFPELRSRLDHDGAALADLIEGCTRKDPKDRCTAEEVVKRAAAILASDTSCRVRPLPEVSAVTEGKQIVLQELLDSPAYVDGFDEGTGLYRLRADVPTVLVVPGGSERSVQLCQIDALARYREARSAVVNFDPTKASGDVSLTSDYYIRVVSGAGEHAARSTVFPIGARVELPSPAVFFFDSKAQRKLSCRAEHVERLDIDSVSVTHPAVALTFMAAEPRMEPREVCKLILAR